MKKRMLQLVLSGLFTLSVGVAGVAFTALIFAPPAFANSKCGTCSKDNINTCFGGCNCKEHNIDETWSCELPGLGG